LDIDVMNRNVFIVGLSVLFASPVAAQPVKLNFEPAGILTGVVSVKDGDGVLFGSVEIRLQGIAAPEYSSGKREKGGVPSSQYLRRLVSGEQLECYLDGKKTKSGGPSGVCFFDGIDIGEHQVAAGHARDCPRFSKGRYSHSEALAVSKGIDLSKTYKLPDYCTPK
jgi:micrococcal nuclease